MKGPTKQKITNSNCRSPNGAALSLPLGRLDFLPSQLVEVAIIIKSCLVTAMKYNTVDASSL